MSKYLLLIFSFVLLVVNSFRLYIVAYAWRALGRMPRFTDAHAVLKPTFISGRTDEMLFFFAHLLTPLLIVIMAVLFFRIVVKNREGLWLIFPLIIVVFEILFRCSFGYQYLMM